MKKTLGFIVLGVAIVLSVTFASYIVLTEFRPEDELRRMLVAMSEIDTVRQKTAFSWSRDEDERVNTTIYASGQLNLENIAKIEHGTRFRVVRLTRNKDYSDLSGEIRALEDTTYLTYDPPGPEVPGVDFSKERLWISFDAGDLPAWGSILPGIEIPIAQADRHTAWTPESIAKLRALLRIADVFHVSFDGETETIGDVETRILDAQFDSDALRAFLREIIRIKSDRPLTDSEYVLVEEQASALERLTIRMWIGVDDHLLYRFQAAGAFPEKEGTNLIPVDILVQFSDFNEPFEVQAPEEENVLPLQEVLGATFGLLPESEEAGGLQGTADQVIVSDDTAHLPTSEVEISNDPDNDGLDNILEQFYGTDPNHPDTDGDGFSDGEEVLNGRNPRGEGSLFGFGLK